MTPVASTRPEDAPASRPAVPATQPVDLTTWWRTLNDPTLDSLIQRAIESNLDLRAATARVREARALRDIAVAGFWPQVNATGSYAYRGSSLNTSSDGRSAGGAGRLNAGGLPTVTIEPGAIDPNTGRPSPPTITVNPSNGGSSNGTSSGGAASMRHRGQNLFQAGFDATWELDVFGRVRREVEAAEADLAASKEALRGVLVSLSAEVALNYVQLRGLQRRLAIAEETIVAQQKSLELTQDKQRAGFTRNLDVAQAAAEVETTRSQVPLLESSIRQTIYQLSLLLGEPPEALLDELTRTGPIPTAPPEIPVGLPSDLLRRRPDIRQAERQLAAATARIGVAVADLFPRFSLNGGLNSQTVDVSHLLDRNSFGWSVGPAFQWPIFEGGRIRANIRVQDARQEQALALYENTVLAAIRDVENAIVAYNNERLRYQALVAAVAANQQATDLSNTLYRGGVITFLNVLISERLLYSSQDQLVQSETAAITNLISLYKALGGGWDATGQ